GRRGREAGVPDLRRSLPRSRGPPALRAEEARGGAGSAKARGAPPALGREPPQGPRPARGANAGRAGVVNNRTQARIVPDAVVPVDTASRTTALDALEGEQGLDARVRVTRQGRRHSRATDEVPILLQQMARGSLPAAHLGLRRGRARG